MFRKLLRHRASNPQISNRVAKSGTTDEIFFFAIFFVAIGIAYFLRKYNVNEDKKLGIPAFLITLLF